MQPDVSVLMAVYNGLTGYQHGWLVEGICRTMHSGVRVELCVVDDASSDDSWAVLAAGADVEKDMNVGRHATRRGPAAAYQTAAEMATGRYVILQSVRSWYEPGALKAMVDALDAHPEVGFVYGQTRYHGASDRLHIPPPYQRARFFSAFDSLFGYMYRREALDAGCRYEHYLTRDGVNIDVADYDFIMQLIVDMGWSGLALRDLLALHYHYSGEGQMTNLVHQHQAEINAVFAERWGEACASVG